MKIYQFNILEIKKFEPDRVGSTRISQRTKKGGGGKVAGRRPPAATPATLGCSDQAGTVAWEVGKVSVVVPAAVVAGNGDFPARKGREVKSEFSGQQGFVAAPMAFRRGSDGGVGLVQSLRG